MEMQGCCVKPGDCKDFTIKLKISCEPGEGGSCCTVTAECCPDEKPSEDKG